jgi:hypothetical protein
VVALLLETFERLPVKVLHRLGVHVQGLLVAVHNKLAKCLLHGLECGVCYDLGDILQPKKLRVGGGPEQKRNQERQCKYAPVVIAA